MCIYLLTHMYVCRYIHTYIHTYTYDDDIIIVIIVLMIIITCVFGVASHTNVRGAQRAGPNIFFSFCKKNTNT